MERSATTESSAASMDGIPAQVVDQDGRNAHGEPEVVIAVMGITGAGKSFLIRETTKEAIVVGDGLKACTQKVEGVTMQYKGNNVTLLDSPGFNDTYRTDTDILYDISTYLSGTYTMGLKLSGVIYLHPISNTRMEGSSLRSLRMFRKLVGVDALHNVILATTHWAEVSEEVGARREKELRNEFFKDLIDNGARMTRYAGNEQSGLELLDMLVGQNRVVLDIQREIVDEKRDLIDTGAGQVVNEEIIRLRKIYETQLERAKEELEEAIRDHDEKSRKEVAEAVEKIEAKLEAAEQESQRLRDRGSKSQRDQRDLMDQFQLLQISSKREMDAAKKEHTKLTNEMQSLQARMAAQAARPPERSAFLEAMPHLASMGDSVVRGLIFFLNTRR